jgi:hypothetical protein
MPYDPPVHLTLATDGRFKLALYHGPPSPTSPPEVSAGQMFDLETDPQEQCDLYDRAEHLSTQRRLLSHLDRFLEAETRQLARATPHESA